MPSARVKRAIGQGVAEKKSAQNPLKIQCFRAGQETKSYGGENLQQPFVFAMFSLSEGLAKEVAEKNHDFFLPHPSKTFEKPWFLHRARVAEKKPRTSYGEPKTL